MTKPVSFSFLGLADDMKGFPEFVELATALAPSWRQAVRFDLIGGTRSGELPPSGPWVTTYTQSGPMPRNLFEATLRETSYAVFPFRTFYYRLTPSGSVLDAFSAGKPVIAIRNSQFEEMFQSMGDIGYLCKDVNEMKNLVATILRDPPRDRYRKQSQNILASRGIYQPHAVATQLREALSSN